MCEGFKQQGFPIGKQRKLFFIKFVNILPIIVGTVFIDKQNRFLRFPMRNPSCLKPPHIECTKERICDNSAQFVAQPPECAQTPKYKWAAQTPMYKWPPKRLSTNGLPKRGRPNA